MKRVLSAAATCAALLAAPAWADGQSGGQLSSQAVCATSGDATCIGGSRGNRPTGLVVSAGAPASAATPNCRQGSADSTCATAVGAGYAPYATPGSTPTPTPCRSLPASQWTGGCPVGKIGSITYQADYSCGYQKVYRTGSLTPTLMIAEPGQYGPGYEIANSCVDPAPPAPPAPTYSYVYSVGSLWGFCGGSTFGGQTQPKLNTAEYTSAGAYSNGWTYCYDLVTPWGYSIQNAFLTLPKAQALAAPMQYLKDKGCSIASESPAAMDAAMAAQRIWMINYGYPASTADQALSQMRANVGIDDYYYSNFAACPNKAPM